MSDEEKPVSERVKRLANFTWEEFSAHTEKHGGFKPCEACGHDEWTGSIDEQGKPIMMQSPLWSKPGEVYLTIPVTCGKCGNIRFFNVGMMANNVGGKRDE